MKYMRFFIGDYHKDTQHLSQTENCAYFLLLMHYAATERPLPDNDKVLSRISKCASVRSWLKIKDIIAEFFTIENGFWYQRKAEEEIEFYKKNNQQKLQAVKKRWQKKEVSTPSANETSEQKEVGDKSQKTLINQRNIDTAVLRPNTTPTPTPTNTTSININTSLNSSTTSYVKTENFVDDVFEGDVTDRKFVREKAIRLAGSSPNCYPTIAEVDKWQDAGCDPILDIFPVIKANMERRKGNPPNSMCYFTQAILNAKANRLKPLLRETYHASSSTRPNSILEALARTAV